jgi:hypothetical protein
MRILLLCLTAALLAVPGAVHAVGEPLLVGTVSNPQTISFTDQSGTPVTQLEPGTYDIEIRDNSTIHNFRLRGPGVDNETEVPFEGTTVWQDVVLQASSSYDYFCEPHESIMKGGFTTSPGQQPPPPPPGPPPPGPPPPGPPPPPAPPPSPPPPPPHPHVHPLELRGLRISVERRNRKRMLVARARINQPAVARLALLRANRVRSSARKRWAAGTNTISTTIPRTVRRGRWTAELRVGALRFRRTIRIG